MNARSMGKSLINGVLKRGGLRIGKYRAPTTGFEVSLREALEGAREPWVFDVGANEGQTCAQVLAIKRDARILAFEPNPEAFAQLVRSMRAETRVRPINCGLGAKSEKSEFHVFESAQSSSFLRPERETAQMAAWLAKEKGTVSVWMRTLDAIVEEEKVEGAIALLKIDVQGFEGEVLAGAKNTLKKVENVLVEVSFNRVYEHSCLVDEVCVRLREAGFGLKRTIGYLPGDEVDDLVSADCFFTRAAR